MISFSGFNYFNGLAMEWLVTNGLGGYASSTITGANSRKYHGLLNASFNPPVDRFQMVAKVEELVVQGKRLNLSVNRYPNLVYPEGYAFLKEFLFEDYPVFRFELDGLSLEKSVCMVHGLNVSIVHYHLEAKKKGFLEVKPLVNCRNIHANTHVSQTKWELKREEIPNGEIIGFYKGSPYLLLASDRATYQPQHTWYYNLVYERELNRGFDYLEDLLNCGTFFFEFPSGKSDFTLFFIASRDSSSLEGVFKGIKSGGGRKLLKSEEIRRKSIVDSFHRINKGPQKDELLTNLVKAADQFIVRRNSTKSKSVIAGYPWFTDWGRDTMISLPGLCISLGRVHEAKSILESFSVNMRNGLIPNRFTDEGGQDYNTVDGSLWFVVAVYEYYKSTGDKRFIKNIWARLKEVVDSFVNGTDFWIRMDEDCLIEIPDPKQNLTWMDAKVGDEVFTPRAGKPVEIQALWYNSLKILEFLAKEIGVGFKRLDIAEKVVKSFNEKFWNEGENCLFDVIGKDRNDSSIRPNQIFALSLPFSILSSEREKSVLNKVEEELLTPFGLRTLSQGDSKYVGVYQGGPYSRDRAYHQGTVWPWLLGPYWQAYLKVNGNSEESKSNVRKQIESLKPHLEIHGLGSVSEIFEAQNLRPDGCIAQAWSVAEILRTMVELG
ncbi:amylo-alpha-1,6-glucosidase [Candidatus Altiarchaeota archaeon]